MTSTIDLTDKQGLENLFADNFSSPYFPVLADLYLQEGDFRRAKLVCEVGLEHDASNDCGKFILAKVAMAENKLTIAEKWLKQTVEDNPVNFCALRMLIRVEFALNRSHKTIQKYIQRILFFIPNDEDCLVWLENMNGAATKVVGSEGSEKNDVKIDNDAKIRRAKASEDSKYNLEESMITFTMVQVLKSQKHYEQALAVLKMLESKELDIDRISREREEINSFLAKNLDT